MGLPIQQALADRDLLPSTHLLDSGYLASQFLVTAQREHQVDVVGPPLGSDSRQRRAGEGDDLHAFTLDWDREVATCPQGHPSVKWTPGHDGRGGAVMRIRFNQAICWSCPVRRACTWAKDAPRQRSVRPTEHYLAMAAARQRQETTAFKAQYALRAGVESTIAQGTRRFALRRSRSIGLARTQLQQIVVAVAINLVRVIAWLWNEPLDEQRRATGHFALLAPRPLSRHALIG